MESSGHDASGGDAISQRRAAREAAREGTREAQQPTTTTGSVQSVVASLGRLGTSSKRHYEYAKTGVVTRCEMYVSLGANQSGFKDWYDTKFVHRVLDPKVAEGVKKSETKRDTLMLNALTSARGTARQPDNDDPEIDEAPRSASSHLRCRL